MTRLLLALLGLLMLPCAVLGVFVQAAWNSFNFGRARLKRWAE